MDKTTFLNSNLRAVRFLLIVLLCLPVWANPIQAQTSESYAVFEAANGVLTFKHDAAKPSGAYSLNVDYAIPEWLSEKENIKKVVFDASFANARPASCDSWFCDCKKLTEIEGIENLNTSEAISMMFMFSGCSGLTSLDVSNFNTDNVRGMNSMFNGCSGLTSLDVSHFNTENVENMGLMFAYCSGLTSLDVSHFNTDNVRSMNSMFYICSGLTSLDVSNFNTSNVVNMKLMFSDCLGLTSLDVSHFNTENVENMWYMFNGCSGLTSLDVSHFNTENVKFMTKMFSGCSGLTTIYASDLFVTTNVNMGEEMFLDCIALKGAIAYDETKTDHRYANYIDGYFTKKDPAAIEKLIYTGDEKTEYFDLQGRRINEMQKGINIVRRGNKTFKVLVK